MGRHAEGFKLRQPGGAGTTYFVRFTHNGRQREFTTGTRDPGEASALAGQRYAEIVSGRRTPRKVSQDLELLIASWISEYEKNHSPKQTANEIMYARAHWIPFFGDLSRLTKESIGDYSRERLTKATRSTVRKELSGLRMFIEWAGLGVEVPSLPKHGHPGKRHKNARKEQATILEPEDVEKLLAALPERGKKHGHPVRAFFRVLWETGLRPVTLERLEVGKHYTRGASELVLGDASDKAHHRRTIPITTQARRALDRILPDVGLIFPRFSHPHILRSAMAAAGLANVSTYDIKHSRISELANTPGVPLAGVQFLVGHKYVSTTARYVRASRAAADAVLGVIQGGGASRRSARNSAKR
jgi:integrase